MDANRLLMILAAAGVVAVLIWFFYPELPAMLR
jgi:hypothetical protein